MMMGAALAFLLLGADEGWGTGEVKITTGVKIIAGEEQIVTGEVNIIAGEMNIIKDLVLLPLGNRSGDPEGGIRVEAKVREYLQQAVGDRIHLVAQEKTEYFLVARRIRRTDSVGSSLARGLGRSLGAEAVLVGSVDLYRGGDSPQVGVSLAMLNTVDGSRIWSNYVSLDGRDFVGLFCQGRIVSLERLTDLAVVHLMKDLPLSYQAEVRDLTPFYLLQAEAFPRVIRGGGVVTLMAKFSSVGEPPARVLAWVAGEEIALHREEGNLYEADLMMPYKSGYCDIELIVEDNQGNRFSFTSGTGIDVDNEPPVVDVTAPFNVFSPRNRKARDHVLFFPKLTAGDRVARWHFEIFDEGGQMIRSAGGEGSLPNGIIWRGEGDQVPVVASGQYSCIFSVTDKAGNQGQSVPVVVTVDITPPKIEVEIQEQGEEILTIAVRVEEETEIDRWKLCLIDDENGVQEIISGQGSPPANVEWELDNKIQGEGKGRYSYVVEASDISGNRFRSEKSLLTEVAAKVVEAIEETVPAWDIDF